MRAWMCVRVMCEHVCACARTCMWMRVRERVRAPVLRGGLIGDHSDMSGCGCMSVGVGPTGEAVAVAVAVAQRQT